MNTNTVSFKYSLNMLPVLVNALLQKKAGLCALLDFLPQAWADLELRTRRQVRRRGAGTRVTVSRLERLAVSRYFDLSQRYLKAYRRALDHLENYREHGGTHLLEKALRQFETGMRFQESHLQARMNLEPMLCERLSRVC